MDLSSFGFKNKNLISFLVAVLIVGGLYSAYNMSKLEDPEIKVKTAMVVAVYPGASAHQVEIEVTDPLEKSIQTMGHIDNIESYSYNDLSIISVELESIVQNADVEQCWDMLRRKVGATSLPSGATATVRDDFGNVYGMFYAVTGDGMPIAQLEDYVELIKREIGGIEGVERVDIYGKRDATINICMMQDKLASLGVSPAEVLTTLNGQNGTNYSGYYENGDNRVRVNVTDKFQTVEDIGNMIIQGHGDDQLRLRDIAIIEESFAEPVRNELLYDGEHAVGLLIAATSGTDIIKVGDKVEEKMAELEEMRLPVGLQCHKVFFQPERVGSALSTFMINLIESVAIVVAILMFFMGLKSGIIIGISLVTIVVGSFLFLGAVDGTMQRVSLGAFILAMGMLVDNAIVIVDGIIVDLKAGKPKMEALTSIGRQTAMPLLGATVIAILAFFPIFLSPDTTGLYVRDLFIVLGVSLLLSWVLALIHVPLMAEKWLVKDTKPSADSNGERVYTGKVYEILQKILSACLTHRITVIVVMLALIVISGLGYTQMRQGFFPDMVYDQLYMEYKLPEGTNSTKVKKDLQEISDYLWTRPEIKHITTSIGATPGRYNLVRSIATPSLSYGELIIDFQTPDDLVANMDSIQAYLSAAYPDAYVKLKRYNLMYKKYPIEAQFQGPDPAVLHQLADSARKIMEASPLVDLITTNWEPMQPVLNIEYDQPAARALGLSRSNISMSVMTAAGGLPIGSFYEGSHKKSLYVKCIDSEGNPIEDLSNTNVFSLIPSVGKVLTKENLLEIQSGRIDKEELIGELLSTTPLKQVAKGITVDYENPVIPRFNGQRAQRVQCSPIPGVETKKAFADVSKKIEAIPLPDGYSLNWQGEQVASERSMKYLFKNFPIAIILMITILILLFKDFKKPAIIFCTLPMLLFGVVIAMLITGKSFGFVAIVGVLGLIGMLIKNGIVLMDEITLQLGRGKEPIRALIDSSQSRLLPVMMASLTTILGMIPLLPDAMFGSMAAAIMGGLLCSSIITLVVIPVLYALFFGIENKPVAATSSETGGEWLVDNRESEVETEDEASDEDDTEEVADDGEDKPKKKKKKKKKDLKSIIILLALAAGSYALASGQTTTLTLEQCREMALKNNKEIAASREQTNVALYSQKSYKALYYPSVKANVVGGYSTAAGELGTTLEIAGSALPSVAEATAIQQGLAEGFQPSATSAYFPGLTEDIELEYEIGPVVMAGVSLEQPIYMGGKIRAANQMAEKAYRMAQLNDTLTAQNVIVATDNAYALLVKAGEMLKVAEKYNELLKVLLGNVQSAYNNGMKPKNDVLRVQVKLNESELNIRKAENAQRLAKMNLCHTIGMPLDSDISVGSEYPVVEDITLDGDISARPEYALLEQQVAIAEQQVTLDASEGRPEIGLMLSANYLYGIDYTLSMGDKSMSDKLFNDMTASALVNVTIPLFHFGEHSNKAKATRAKLEKARHERDDKNEQMQLQLTQAANNLDEARLECEIAEKSLSQAEESMYVSRKNFETGMESLSDYLESQTLWQQAYETQVEAHFNLYLSTIAYKKAAGRL